MILQYMYPSGTHLCSFTAGAGYGTHDSSGWTSNVGGDCTPYVDEFYGGLDETGYAIATSRSVAGIWRYGQFEWLTTAPPQGCTISKVQLWAYVRKSYGNSAQMESDPTIMGFVRQNSGATRNYAASAVTVSNRTFRNRVGPTGTFVKVDLGSWDVCPWTSAAWTQADLAAGTFIFGIASDGTHGSGIPPTEGGNQASLDVASTFLELTTTPLDTAEPVRSVISQLLRLFRKPLKLVSIRLPPQFGEIVPGDTIYSAHPLLPVSGGTIGLDVWKQVPLYVIGVRDELEPPAVVIDCLDLRQVYANFWSPLYTTIGVTDDYRGIAKVDRGGGWETVRDAVAYVQRPGDNCFQQVATDRATIGKDGLLIEGGADTNIMLNSTFSLGTSVFTYWTQATNGSGTVTADAEAYLLDLSGYRRSVKVTSTAAGDYAYVYQTTASITANTVFHVNAWGRNDSGDDQLVIRITRAIDGYFWNETTGAWQAATATNYLSSSATWSRWVSSAIDIGASNSTVTVYFGLVITTGANTAHLGAVEVVTASKPFASRRLFLPTQHSAAARTATQTWLNNDVTYRVWPVDSGWVKFTFKPSWSHSELEDNDTKYLLYADHNTTAGYSSVLRYLRTASSEGYWMFDITSSGGTITSLYSVSGGALPSADRSVRIAARWTSVAYDEFDLGAQACQIFVDSQDPSTPTPNSLLTELRAYWRLDEASGVRADVHSGYDFTDPTSVTSTSGLFGLAAKFDSALSQYLTVTVPAGAADLNVGTTGGGASMNFWFKTTDGSNYPFLLGFDPTIGNKRPFEMYLSGGNLLLRAETSAGESYNVGPIQYNGVNDNAWHMATGVYRVADKKLYLYVDGTSQAISSAGDSEGLLTTATEPFRIGKWQFGSYTGLEMATGLWNRELTTDEITTLYNGGDGLDYPFGIAGSASTGGTEPSILDEARVYIGSHATATDDEYADGTFTELEIGAHPMSATELKARTGTIISRDYFPETADVLLGGTATASAIPFTRTVTVGTQDLKTGGTATAQNVPTIKTATVTTQDVKMAGAASTAFQSA